MHNMKRLKHSSAEYKRHIRRRKAIKNLIGEIMYHIYYSSSESYIQTLSEGEKQ